MWESTLTHKMSMFCSKQKRPWLWCKHVYLQQHTLVDVPLASALDHDVPELERLPNVLENRGRLLLVPRADEVRLGEHPDRAVTLGVDLQYSKTCTARVRVRRFSRRTNLNPCACSQ